ncbi:hypothetical protein Pmar_PMAR011882, partial [Perkinsus marinus ATCC 50983]
QWRGHVFDGEGVLMRRRASGKGSMLRRLAEGLGGEGDLVGDVVYRGGWRGGKKKWA